MKDEALVVSTKKDLAQVEVSCLIESCYKCSARSVCAGQNQSKGIITVKNPLKACPGDEVEIEIPDTKYSKALMLLFGSLLIASLLGMAAGYLLSSRLPLSSSEASLLGLLFSLILAGFSLSLHFRGKNKDHFYPVIINIIKKGDDHG